MWPIFPEKQTHPSEFVIERTPQEFAFVEPEKRGPIYFFAVASNAAKPIGGHVSFLVDISDDLIKTVKNHAGKETRIFQCHRIDE